jgi:four helix bundle protein
MDVESNKDPLSSDCFEVTCMTLELCRELDIPERALVEQLRRSVVSIGSNMTEAHGAETYKLASSKLAIAYRECKEARFQLSLIKHLAPTRADVIAVIDNKLDSIAARLYTGIRTLREKAQRPKGKSDQRFR